MEWGGPERTMHKFRPPLTFIPKNMLEGYTFSVHARFEKEIWKRGLYTQRQDENGNVVKRRSESGPSSFVGYGTVLDTLPVLNKYHTRMLGHLDEIIAQLVEPKDHDEEIEALFRVPEEPARKQQRVEEEVELPRAHVCPMVREWHAQLQHNFDNGCIGLLPPAFEKELPSLDYIMATEGGQALNHFAGFVRKKFTP